MRYHYYYFLYLIWFLKLFSDLSMVGQERVRGTIWGNYSSIHLFLNKKINKKIKNCLFSSLSLYFTIDLSFNYLFVYLFLQIFIYFFRIRSQVLSKRASIIFYLSTRLLLPSLTPLLLGVISIYFLLTIVSQIYTLTPWESRKWSPIKEAVDCNSNSPCRHLEKCKENSVEKTHVNV